MSRKLVVVVALGAIAASAMAGPQLVSYQGSVTSAGGSPVPDGSYDMRFTLFDAATGGTNLWTETDSAVAVTAGLFSSILGDTTAFGNLFSTNPDLWLEVAIDVGGNAAFEPDEVFAPRQRLAAAAWAIEADFLEGHPASFFQQRVTGTAPAGRYIRAINADGTVVTAPDADTHDWPSITGIPAGFADDIDNDTFDWPSISGKPSAFPPTAHGHIWTELSGIPAGFADGIDNDSGGDITGVNAGVGLTGGGGSGNVGLNIDETYFDGRYWSNTGNAGTTSGTHFLGTTDAAPLDLRTNSTRALRLEATAGTPNLVGGYGGNSAPTGVVGATVGGGGAAAGPNRVTDDYGTVGGGANNQGGNADGNSTNRRYASVGGGLSNTASASYATVGGGYSNTGSGTCATVGGGYHNSARGDRATVSGGRDNAGTAPFSTVAGGLSNTASASYTTVGGGRDNRSTASYSVIGGGWQNDNGGQFATLGGGLQNTISGDRATLGGGEQNQATGRYATVAGGAANTAGGGKMYATVGGGVSNGALGYASTVPGGYTNIAAGDFGFAAGRRARANNEGSFAWADSTNADFSVSNDNRFGVRASGGVYLYTTGSLTAGSYLAAGSGTWASVSDRDQKENVEAVDAGEVLEKLSAVPVSTWNYKSEDTSIRHMGPMAQDLHAAFGLGDSDKSIATIDADGISLAAIQGVYEIIKEKNAEIEILKHGNAAQEKRIGKLEAEKAAQQQKIAELEARLWAIEARLSGQ